MDSAIEVHREGWFANLLRVALWPRTTMRRILDQAPRPSVVPLVLLAVLAFSLKDVDSAMFRALRETPLLFFAVAGALLLAAGLMLGLFYLFAWIATVVARQLEGSGDAAATRVALAWGFAPVIWSLVYRIPLLVFTIFTGLNVRDPALRLSEEGFTFAPGRLTQGCGMTLFMATIELLLFLWWGYVASRTMAEAHRFSAWRGLGTICITMAAPIVIAIAAALTSLT